MDAFSPTFQDEEAARDYLERLRWPNGPACLHCGNDGSKGRVARIKVKSSRRRLYKCYAKDCRKQFSLTQGTIFEDSHIPVRFWLFAIYRMSASKKGISAFQLHREMGITAKTAWFMAHRIRYAMADESMVRLLTTARAEDVSEDDKLDGIVEADEVYLGPRKLKGVGTAWLKHKTPVLTLIERGGRARSSVMTRSTARRLRKF